MIPLTKPMVNIKVTWLYSAYVSLQSLVLSRWRSLCYVMQNICEICISETFTTLDTLSFRYPFLNRRPKEGVLCVCF